MRKHLLSLLCVVVIPAAANDLCQIVDGSVIIAQDNKNTYLGKITNSFDSDSIFNDFGAYGNEFSSDSIWNEFSTFGNQFNAYSPFNEFSSLPPMIIKNKQVIGYLSANSSIEASISPNILKIMCGD
ncbi:hypothetical protein [Pseudidiomarina mangrovi]|uniref:hypothetical protein n=1 Tax=Pseudidiomarina mangrovi TaxID=2487133 RepID=UPI000FCC8A20|nr:hypothetical protein [Pseudidiomarina mangrovi]